jgi:hypothetical protein
MVEKQYSFITYEPEAFKLLLDGAVQPKAINFFADYHRFLATRAALVGQNNQKVFEADGAVNFFALNTLGFYKTGVGSYMPPIAKNLSLLNLSNYLRAVLSEEDFELVDPHAKLALRTLFPR